MKITPSVLIGSLSGSSGDVTASTWKGRGYARKRVTPANPNTENQQAQRTAFAACVACYAALAAAIKTFLDILGTARQMSGFNVMMSTSVKAERDDFMHPIVPANSELQSILNYTVASGDQSGEIDLT
ncbi:MAG: DUF6266 family protein, partial [candidate division Zixibacteria bacterium]|nr:DUF6266 family protein [candidate division Zixibacteria bacterium]